MKQWFTRVGVAASLIYMLGGMSSCANIIPPGGGPRDSIPPVLVLALPKDSAVNVPVTLKQATLTFDEYVTVENAFTNLIVSPLMKNAPEVQGKFRNVTIRIRDTLQPNTTYSFDFGDAIGDVNEKNLARGIRYIFSTGSRIDFNEYSGKVIVSETGRTDSTLFAILHTNLSDTAVLKLPPRYYTRVNGKGEFRFRNLPAGEFAVYIIPQSSFTKTYMDSTALFAFKNGTVSVGPDTKADTLYAFAHKKQAELPLVSTVRPPTARDDRRLRYSADLDNGTQDILRGMNLNFLKKLTVFDSTKFVLTDTVYRTLPGSRVSIDTNRTQVSIQYAWKESAPYRLLIAKDAVADSAGNTLSKADTIRFFAKRESDYGSIRIRFTNLNIDKNPILQLVKEDRVIESFPLIQPEVYRKLYHPGTYDMRILYDTNRNGVWDPGSYRLKQQPEIVQLIRQTLTIRANWENDVTVGL